METLNVTLIEPRRKHATIFETFDALAEGASFVIHNDHDPVPLYYQLIAERGETFEWEYLLRGPAIFEIKITKLLKNEKSETIGEMVAKDYRKAEVFKKFGIDFCCGGFKTIKEVCVKKGIDASKVLSEIEALDKTTANHVNKYNDWELDFLAQYITNNHHSYVVSSIPILHELGEKVARKHGQTNPEVVDVYRNFIKIASELTDHMHKEERVLFPYIIELSKAQKENRSVAAPHFGSIKNPIAMMEAEHEDVGGLVEQINQWSNNLTPPEDACGSYKVLYAKLNEFIQDLYQHIHLENNILFPKAIELEQKIINS